MKEVIMVGLVILILYYLLKNITGGIAMGVTLAVVIIMSYVIITRVFHIEIPFDIDLPPVIDRTDEKIDEIEERQNYYEYRDVYKK